MEQKNCSCCDGKQNEESRENLKAEPTAFFIYVTHGLAASSRTHHGRTFKKPGFEGLLKRGHFLVTESHFLPIFRAPYGPPHEGLPKLSRGEVYIERRLKDA